MTASISILTLLRVDCPGARTGRNCSSRRSGFEGGAVARWHSRLPRAEAVSDSDQTQLSAAQDGSLNIVEKFFAQGGFVEPGSSSGAKSPLAIGDEDIGRLALAVSQHLRSLQQLPALLEYLRVDVNAAMVGESTVHKAGLGVFAGKRALFKKTFSSMFSDIVFFLSGYICSARHRATRARHTVPTDQRSLANQQTHGV